MHKTLIIGLGGVGAEVCARIATRGREGGKEMAERAPRLLLFDVAESLEEPLAGQTVRLTAAPALLDAVWREPARYQAEWIDRDAVRDVGSLGKGVKGNRMLGRLMLLLPDNQRLAYDALSGALTEMDGADGVTVICIAHAGGGFGSGTLADWGYLLHALRETGYPITHTRAVLLLPTPDSDAAVNSYATLTELNYLSDPRTEYVSPFAGLTGPFTTRERPFDRIELTPPLDAEDSPIDPQEMLERVAVRALAQATGDQGDWRCYQSLAAPALSMADEAGNPQPFATFGVEWLEYPEPRLADAVYRNLLRQALEPWLQGARELRLDDAPQEVPLQDSEAMLSALLGNTKAESHELAPFLRRLEDGERRLPTGRPADWPKLNEELMGLIARAPGTRTTDPAEARGSFADRYRNRHRRSDESLRTHACRWLEPSARITLAQAARFFTDYANALATAGDPARELAEQTAASRQRMLEVLTVAAGVRRDRWLFPYRRRALTALAGEYAAGARGYAMSYLRGRAVPFLRDIRERTAEMLNVWSERARGLQRQLQADHQRWADEEAGLLQGLWRDNDDERLALGAVKLPGVETPYLSTMGWALPNATGADVEAAVAGLQQAMHERWISGELALTTGGESALDGAPAALSQEIAQATQALRSAVEDSLASWLGGDVLERLSEEHPTPVELEYRLRQLVDRAAELPLLEAGYASRAEAQTAFLGLLCPETADEQAEVVEMALRHVPREMTATRLDSRLPQLLLATCESAGFSLPRASIYLRYADRCADAAHRPEGLSPFSRADMPWYAAPPLPEGGLDQARRALTLAVVTRLLRPNGDGVFPLPPSLLPVEGAGGMRLPLPADLEMAARQLAGDERALEALEAAVAQQTAGHGVEWVCLQIRQILNDASSLGMSLSAETAEGRTAELYRLVLDATATDKALQEEALRTFPGLTAASLYREAAEERDAGYYCPACEHRLGAAEADNPERCPECDADLYPERSLPERGEDFRRIPNPYVAGTPLEPGSAIFVGREDIIQQVRDHLIRPAQRTILILIGERRSGKTSALKQLEQRLEADLTPLYIDMQGLTASDLPGFLWWLAWRIKESLAKRGVEIEVPEPAAFAEGPADYLFESQFLPAVREKLRGGRLLLMLDEFEVLAQRVMDGTFDTRAFDYLRHLMQHSEGLEFLFAGTHVLRQFAANYVTFLFNIGLFLEVDFLSEEAARELITKPVSAAGVTYTPEAVEALLEQAGAHAYFTQLFCFQLVERLNRTGKREITTEDVLGEREPVIQAAGAHLDHLWSQLENRDRLLLSFFVERTPEREPVTDERLLELAVAEEPKLRPYLCRNSMDRLVELGLLKSAPEGGGRQLRLAAEIYREWVRHDHPYGRLREEGVEWD